MGARSRTSWMLASAVSAVGGFLLAAPASNALTFEEWSPAEVCGAEARSNEIVERGTKLLNPAEGETVQVGTPMTFSAEGGAESPLTFEVASSPTLISDPDVDSGPGVREQLGVPYSFTSSKATSVPRTIYWAVTFTRVLRGCEGPPVTFTTPVRSLTVVASCIVPTLRGRSLSAARRALRSSHCALGAVHRPAAHRGKLVVVRQAVAPGSKLPAGARVGVRLGSGSGTSTRPSSP